MQYSSDVIVELINQHREIDKISLTEFPATQTFQDRLELTYELQRVMNIALQTREKYHLPFWDSLLLTQFDYRNFSQNIIDEAFLHNRIKRFFLNRNEVEKIGELAVNMETNIGINSLVITNRNENLHIPLLDFHIPNLETNMPCILSILYKLGMPGYLIKTNKSFHFYGSRLLTEDDLITFLSRSLLFSPIIDKNWVSHQLIERSATLRITSKQNERPYVICKV